MEENTSTITQPAFPRSLIEGFLVVIIIGVIVFLSGNGNTVEALTPEQVFDKFDEAKQALIDSDTTTVSFDGNLLVDIEMTNPDSDEIADIGIDLTADGSIDLNNDNNIDLNLDLNVNLLKYSTGPLNIDIGNPNAEIRVVDDTLYFNINKLDKILFYNPKVFNNRWIYMDAINFQDELKEILDVVLLDNKNDRLFDVFNTIEDLGVKKIKGQKAYHYKVTFNQDAFEDEELISLFSYPLYAISPTQKFNVKEIPVEIWIGSSDFMILKVYADVPIENLLPEDANSVTFKGSYLMEFNMFDHGKILRVQIPDNSISIEKIQQEIEQELLNGQLEPPIHEPIDSE